MVRGDQRLLAATLAPRAERLTARPRTTALGDPAMTHRVTAGIYAQAARLRRRAPFYATRRASPNGRCGGGTARSGQGRRGAKP